MPAKLVPNDAIPHLAARVDSPEMLKILHHIQQVGFILNGGDVDAETARILNQLAALGLVDPGYEGPPEGPPSIWVSNGNGSRVLKYLASIPVGPHYEILSSELAAWLEEQGPDRWWNVDGDPLLAGRRPFPCPASELAAELRRIGRPLLVQAKKDDANAKGQRIGKEKLNDLVEPFAENLHAPGPGQLPPWGSDRFFYLRWKGSSEDWLLVEDSETTEQMRAEEILRAVEAANTKRE
ncbi:MAG: hypothetical protein L0Z62_44950 [Gemmataceae bacterium]|nr:hypothetical protein [Gemmataceae bacterium]